MKLFLCALTGAFLLVGCSKPSHDGDPVQLTQSVKDDVAAGKLNQTPPPEEKSELDKIQEAGRTEAEAHGASAPDGDKTSPPPAENQDDPSNGYNQAGHQGDKQWDAGYNTKEFQAVFLFQINGCRVYRFYDGGAWQFFQDCRYN